MHKVYIDTETCGLHSQPVLLQHAEDDGPIVLTDMWRVPIRDTLRLIEWYCEHTVVGFNLAFDWFQLVKWYTICRLANPDWIPCEHIQELALLEPQGQDGPCIKPAGALDLLLHSRKGPYQSLMAREDVRIKKVPTALAYALADELEDRIAIDGIYFAKSADKDAPRWQVFDRKDRKTGEIDTDFKDVCLRFNPAGGLKFLAEHALKLTPKYHYKDVEPPTQWRPYELGYSPTALSLSSPEKDWEVWRRKEGEMKMVGHAWPAVISKFIDHWATNAPAREYASDDIVYTRKLDEHFGFPAPNDDDSVLACMVPVIRWRGFTIDIEGIKALMAEAQAKVDTSPVNINKPKEVRRYISECLDDTEVVKIEISTKKANIEAIAKYAVKTYDQAIADLAASDAEDNIEVLGTDGIEGFDDIKQHEHCNKCDGKGHHEEGVCRRCEGRGHMVPGPHPGALRAKAILDVKHAAKEKELYGKLLIAKKFHASFTVVGTLSNRMAGGDGLNAQGIKKSDSVRRMFPIAWDGYQLCGGDFDSFEVTLADAVYKDPSLRAALTTTVRCYKCGGTGIALCKKKGCKGCDKCVGGSTGKECDDCDGIGITFQKIHALFAMSLYPGVTYEDVLESSGSDGLDMYGKGKSGVFGMIYGGDWNTLVQNLTIDPDAAKAAFARFEKSYPGVKKAREKTFVLFCSMKQPGGIGTNVVWEEPAQCVVSFLGFRRWFTLENMVCHALFHLARKPPKAWKDIGIKVVRSQRVQTAAGAVASALYGAAFAMQAMNMRAAANHEIQSPGGQITKHVQRAIWDLQPVGVHKLLVGPMNVHDELLVSTDPSMVSQVTEKVRTVVESYRDRVPLIGMSWCEEMANWAEKKSGTTKVKIRAPEMTIHATAA